MINVTLNEQAEKITATLYYFNNKTQNWLEKNIDWLQTISAYGISLFLERAERMKYVDSRCIDNETSELEYFITTIGRVMVETKKQSEKSEMMQVYATKINEIVTRAEKELSQLANFDVRLHVYTSDPMHSDVAEKIKEAIEIVCNISFETVKGLSRKREIVLARHLYCYFMATRSKLSLDDIGLSINRDHTTVIHGRESIKDKISCNDSIVLPAVNSVINILDIEQIKIEKLLDKNAA
jgi:hypothetical protein